MQLFALESSPLACAGTSRVFGHGVGQGMCVKGLCCPKRCLSLGLLLSSLPHQLVKQILVQHPCIHRAPGGVGERGGICEKREHPSPGASWHPSGSPRVCQAAVGLQEGAVLLCNPCMGDLFFFSCLADPRSAPASPSLRLPRRDTEPWGCSTGRGTERLGKRFGKGSLKSSVQGRGQCSSC